MAKGFFYADADTKGLLFAFKNLPKDLQAEIRKHNRADSEELARAIKENAYRENVPPQAALIVESGAVMPRTDRTIRVDVGGPKILQSKSNAFRKNAAGELVKRKGYRANNKKKRSKKVQLGTRAGAVVWGATMGSSGNATDRAGRKMGLRFVEKHSSRGYWLQPTSAAWVDKLLPRWKARIQSAVERSHRGVS